MLWPRLLSTAKDPNTHTSMRLIINFYSYNRGDFGCGVLGEDAHSFFWDLAKRLEAVNEDRRSHQFLLQQVAVAVQRGNTASVLGSIASRN